MFGRCVTERIAPSQRIRRWCEFGSSTLSWLDVQPYEPADFRAQLIRATLGDFGVAQTRSTPAHAWGRGGHLGAWASSRDAAGSISLHKTGNSKLVQAGRKVDVSAGRIGNSTHLPSPNPQPESFRGTGLMSSRSLAAAGCNVQSGE